jgi:hypothetical protein
MIKLKSTIFLLVLIFFLTVSVNTAINNCLSYSASGTLCTQCQAGYYLTNSATVCTAYDCSSMSNCNLCDTTSTCLTCNFGYKTNSNRTACSLYTCDDSHCSLCASSAVNQCYVCAAAYYETTSHTCTSCTTSISNCL